MYWSFAKKMSRIIKLTYLKLTKVLPIFFYYYRVS
jgi:hypothetical protein